jgi:hypothetical protein
MPLTNALLELVGYNTKKYDAAMRQLGADADVYDSIVISSGSGSRLIRLADMKRLGDYLESRRIGLPHSAKRRYGIMGSDVQLLGIKTGRQSPGKEEAFQAAEPTQHASVEAAPPVNGYNPRQWTDLYPYINRQGARWSDDCHGIRSWLLRKSYITEVGGRPMVKRGSEQRVEQEISDYLDMFA